MRQAGQGILMLAVLLELYLAGCSSAPSPVGQRTANIDELLASDWITQDTLIRIDPKTFAEEMIVDSSDRSPDTLMDGSVIYQIAEYMPVFAGCEDDADPALCTQRSLNEFVDKHLRYPRNAQVQGIQGSAIASFVIRPDGRVSDTGIQRTMGDELDRSVLDLVGKMPVWNPGFHEGRPVAVRYRLPVTFRLPED